MSDSVTHIDEARLRAFFVESLALWQVAAMVHPGTAPVIAEIRAANGAIVWIERASEDVPFKWFARWRLAGDAPGGVREVRPCACSSMVGLLAAVREALGVERGSAVRVVAAPEQI